MKHGAIFGTPTEAELEFAEKIARHVKCVDMLRFTNSGGEAVMYALRVARGFTGKQKIAKFEGGYHGNFDEALISISPLLDRSGSENNPVAVPHGIGIPKSTVDNVVILPFNNVEATETLIEKNASELAAVIIEPIQGFAGVIPANKQFISFLRRLTEKHGILLIFDEIITGFRSSLGGAKEYSDVVPDLVTMGKTLSGGFPLGVYGGRKDVMNVLTPHKDLVKDIETTVFQTGTFNANALTMAAGLATLKVLEKENEALYGHIDKMGSELIKGIRDAFSDFHIDAQVTGVPSVFNTHFTSMPINNVRDVLRSDFRKHVTFNLKLASKGVFIPPPVHLCLSYAHSKDDIGKTLEAVSDVAKEMKQA